MDKLLKTLDPFNIYQDGDKSGKNPGAHSRQSIERTERTSNQGRLKEQASEAAGGSSAPLEGAEASSAPPGGSKHPLALGAPRFTACPSFHERENPNHVNTVSINTAKAVRMLWCDTAGIRRCRWDRNHRIRSEQVPCRVSPAPPHSQLQTRTRTHAPGSWLGMHTPHARNTRTHAPASGRVLGPSSTRHAVPAAISLLLSCPRTPHRVIPSQRYKRALSQGVCITTACMAMPAYGDSPVAASGLSAVRRGWGRRGGEGGPRAAGRRRGEAAEAPCVGASWCTCVRVCVCVHVFVCTAHVTL